MNWNSLFDRSYTPYSNKAAACIVEGKSGRHYPGVRIENISFPLTIAEDQAAVCFCLSEGDSPAGLILPSTDHTDRSFWIDLYNLTVEHRDDIEHVFIQNHSVPADTNPEKELKRLTAHAVTPNSNFNVSALLGTGGGFISGVNVEFGNWQQGLCAERFALAKAFSLGFSTFDSIHIHADAGDFISPCGACRQVLVEHLPHHPVYLYHPDGSHSVYFSDQLLPYHMKTDTLKKRP